jgi:hypothetical protein
MAQPRDYINELAGRGPFTTGDLCALLIRAGRNIPQARAEAESMLQAAVIAGNIEYHQAGCWRLTAKHCPDNMQKDEE